MGVRSRAGGRVWRGSREEERREERSLEMLLTAGVGAMKPMVVMVGRMVMSICRSVKQEILGLKFFAVEQTDKVVLLLPSNVTNIGPCHPAAIAVNHLSIDNGFTIPPTITIRLIYTLCLYV